MNLIGGVTRGDQAMFMAAKKAPNVRWHMITNFLETLKVDGEEVVLTSQRMQGKADLEGFRYLKKFVFEHYPVWTWEAFGITVTRSVVIKQGNNTVAVE
ncbi:MAG: glycogen debranching enzyme N-terminal domain-containing protein, partial [Lachnospiraceae bacterium]|nr:glycogen debranching enzyme N-terminal domain-containing protein [Lachnospiraceae bacterium]